MSLSETKAQKYNTYVVKLFKLILALNLEEQRFLLKNIEKFLYEEKRTTARKDCQIPVNCFYNERFYDHFITNISRDGCFIETQTPLSVGEPILMDILLDGDGQSIRVKGEVANINRRGMGIEFVEVSGEVLEQLGYLLYRKI
jgi:hypothetical protein